MKRIVTLMLLVLLTFSARAGKPVIGVSPSFSNGKISVNSSYLISIERAGGVPLVLPMVADEEMADAVIARVDGLLMTGGEDVAPAYYGEEIFNSTVSINAPRDTTDMLLIAAARKRGLPVLGICRGEQAVNVSYGGSLWQDLPSQVGTAVSHRQEEPASTGTHWVYIEKGTQLHSLLKADSIKVNSFHHQAVKQIADGLTVSARAADGVVEGYEGDGILCVQFHPEGFVSKGDSRFLPIFEEFVSESRSRMHKGNNRTSSWTKRQRKFSPASKRSAQRGSTAFQISQ